MRALAWDDEPEKYIKTLAEHLKTHGIDVTVCADQGEFIAKLHAPDARWDFVITDLVQENIPAVGDKDPHVGASITQNVPVHLPIFLITRHYNSYDFSKLAIPLRVVIRSKSTHAGWQAAGIRDELRRFGLFTNHRKVFLIYGHDRTIPGATAAVKKHLNEQHRIKVEQITPDTLFTEINHGLLERMHDCAAIIAICTPDDKVEGDGKGIYYQPRQNVLYEIGVALGLARGLQRLTILQKKGKEPDQRATLPSDLGGVVPIRFEEVDKEVFDRLDERLRELGVELAS